MFNSRKRGKQKSRLTVHVQIKEPEKNIVSLARPEYKKQMVLLTSVKGIGIIFVAALIMAIGGSTYFDNVKQLTRYPGLSPAV